MYNLKILKILIIFFCYFSEQCKLPCENQQCIRHGSQRKCVRCKRHLREGLFERHVQICNACMRRRPQRGAGQPNVWHSVNYTFATFDLEEPHQDPLVYLQSIRLQVQQHLKDRLNVYRGVKWYLNLQVCLSQETESGTASIETFFNSNNTVE